MKPQNLKNSGLKSYNQTYTSINNQTMGSKIAKLQETGTLYEKNLETEQKKLKYLENEIKTYEQKLQEKREEVYKKKRGINGNQSRASQNFRIKQPVSTFLTDLQQQQQQIQQNNKFQNRAAGERAGYEEKLKQMDAQQLQKNINQMNQNLDNLKKQINVKISQKRDLKENINSLRKEKNIYDQIYAQLKEELEIKKQQLDRICQESISAEEEIKLSKEKLSEFQKMSQEDRKKYEQDFNKVFMLLEEQKEMEIIQTQPQKQNKMLSSDIKEPSNPNASNVNKQLKSQQDEIQNLEDLKSEVNYYEEIFQQLMEQTESKDISEIVEKFKQYEEENYNLFKYISNLYDESEELKKQKKDLQDNIKDYQKQYSDANIQLDPRKLKYKQLQQEYEQLQQEKDSHQKKQGNLQETIDKLKLSIPEMFEKIGCNQDEYLQNLPQDFNQTDEVDENSLIQYLEVIEQRTHDLLQIYNQSLQNSDLKNQMKFDDSPNQSQVIIKQRQEDIENKIKELESEYVNMKEQQLKLDEKWLDKQDFVEYYNQTVEQQKEKKQNQKKKQVKK